MDAKKRKFHCSPFRYLSLLVSGLVLCAFPLQATDTKCVQAAESVGRSTRAQRRTENRERQQIAKQAREALKLLESSPLDTPDIERIVETAIETGDPKPVVAEIQRVIREKNISKQIIDERLAWFAKGSIVPGFEKVAKLFEDADAVDAEGLKNIAHTTRVLREIQEALQSAYPQKSPTVTIEEAMDLAVKEGDFQELDLHVAELSGGYAGRRSKAKWRERTRVLEDLRARITRDMNTNYGWDEREPRLPALRFREPSNPVKFNFTPGKIAPNFDELRSDFVRIENTYSNLGSMSKQQVEMNRPKDRSPNNQNESIPTFLLQILYPKSQHRLIYSNYSALDLSRKLDAVIHQIEKKTAKNYDQLEIEVDHLGVRK